MDTKIYWDTNKYFARRLELIKNSANEKIGNGRVVVVTNDNAKKVDR